ncbi:hypothetical protein EDD27_7958 [Nonomuraea polychroma]|uniref:Uncharacterized protein n=1 Tax=Nonomuraea polychroma TaxID=46176 RepID=A0A438MHQ1_9ACTN|nr:hypothetical protein EDD27_7958 [Nonomuraea polychroma]
MVEYVLERFLYRLAASPLGGRHFILKGGLLPAPLRAGRCRGNPASNRVHVVR